MKTEFIARIVALKETLKDVLYFMKIIPIEAKKCRSEWVTGGKCVGKYVTVDCIAQQ